MIFIKDLLIVFVGIISGLVLFYQFPIIKKQKPARKHKVSIIIPCRNEENNIKILLNLLSKQDYPIDEIICVDDESTDNTAQIIKKFGAKLISIRNRPDDWNGKPYAMTKGAESAKGDILLFLDADVKLKKNSISSILSAYEKYGIISIHPYHRCEKAYESLAVFFNHISIAGTGITLPKQKQTGMFGMIFAVDRKTYFENGGHSEVKQSIIEDFDLGKFYRKKGIKYKLLIGNNDIAFQMYPEGIKSQFQGFSKNFSNGVLSTSVWTTILTFLWITSLFIIPTKIVFSIIEKSFFEGILYCLIYIFVATKFSFNSKKIGKFNNFFLFFYPIPLLWFFVVFLYSFVRKLFFHSAVWKGRKIRI